MNKIGMHIHALSSEAYQAVRRLQPRLITIMDPSAQWIQDLRAVSPGTTIVGRRYEDNANFWQGVEPGEYARRCYDMVAPQLADGWVSANEPFGHDDHHLFEAFDRWQAAFVVALRELGMEGVVNNFGTGNFTGGLDRIKITEAFPRTCQVARVYGPHDYDWPHMERSVGWRALRWIKWLEDLRAAGIENVRIAVTEAGVTQATYGGPDIGWQTLDDNLMVAADLYLDSLRWYNEKLIQIPECIGCATYDWAGSAFGWPTFEHLIPYLVEGIAELSAEPPDNGGNDMVTVYNLEGQALTGEVAAEEMRKYGAAIRTPTGLQKGDRYYRITTLWVKTGHASFVSTVKDIKGQPVVNRQEELDLSKPHRAFWWADAPELDPLYPMDWEKRADVGGLDENGTGGSGLGSGAYTGYYEDPMEGPHRAWVRHPSIPSEQLVGIRMIGLTNHDHVDALWEEAEYEGDGPPPPTPEPGEILERLERILGDAEWIRGRLVEVDALAEELADAL